MTQSAISIDDKIDLILKSLSCNIKLNFKETAKKEDILC